jgi:hypothetical protein
MWSGTKSIFRRQPRLKRSSDRGKSTLIGTATNKARLNTAVPWLPQVVKLNGGADHHQPEEGAARRRPLSVLWTTWCTATSPRQELPIPRRRVASSPQPAAPDELLAGYIHSLLPPRRPAGNRLKVAAANAPSRLQRLALKSRFPGAQRKSPKEQIAGSIPARASPFFPASLGSGCPSARAAPHATPDAPRPSA